MSFWASLQIHFLPFNLSVSSQPKIWILQNLWCNNLRRLNLLCCTDFGTWKGIKSTEIDKNILNWHNTEICQFLRNTPDCVQQTVHQWNEHQPAGNKNWEKWKVHDNRGLGTKDARDRVWRWLHLEYMGEIYRVLVQVQWR